MLDTATPLEQARLNALYRWSSGAQLWIDDMGRPAALAHEALALAGRAQDDGLDLDDYGAVPLIAEAVWLGAGCGASDADRATFDRALSLAMLRYLHDVHEGRIDPREVGALISDRDESTDVLQVLSSARQLGTLAAVRDALAPRFSQYARLREALARYRALASRTPSIPAVALDHTVRPGDALPDAIDLRAELMAYGDLPAGPVDSTGDRYDGLLADGVRRFQHRHGLIADGVIGPRTRDELAVPVAARVRQLELAMERLRWLPAPTGDRVIAVNVPMFRLWAVDGADRDRPPLETNVIVGEALRRETPVLLENMTAVVFRPYWNVPTSILRDELLPKIRRDPAYLDRGRFEIVNGSGDDAPVLQATPESIATLGVTTRLRQRPGAGNSLGLVKFVLPNRADVYLHGTPFIDLFARDRRDLSHGCVRVEDNVGLAVWALDDPAWDRGHVLAAMHEGPDNHRVRLGQPVQVLLFYTTAVVSPEDGTVLFAHDWYGRDRALDDMLRLATRTRRR